MWGKRGKERSERHVQRMERIVVRNYFRGARLVGCFQRGMNVLEHFGPIKETACLFKRDIQFARLFEKFLKKKKKGKEKEKEKISLSERRANVFGIESGVVGGWVVTAWKRWIMIHGESSLFNRVIFCSSFGN